MNIVNILFSKFYKLEVYSIAPSKSNEQNGVRYLSLQVLAFRGEEVKPRLYQSTLW
ncbi:hypothetical protein ANABIO32_04860 [Rossellomorea marisflavi]|nr:hypothetical protein ANABIO32_04860 [Rossellomorea marisflavi]